MLLRCLDYWVNRYQTLIVGLLAVGLAWWAGMAAWQQVTETRRQVTNANRERLVARYRMTKTAIELIDDFLAELTPFGDRPDGTEPVADEYLQSAKDYVEALKSKYVPFRTSMKVLALSSSEAAIRDHYLGGIPMLFIQSAEEALGAIHQSGLNATNAGAYFYAEQPMANMKGHMMEMRKALEGAMDATVGEIIRE